MTPAQEMIAEYVDGLKAQDLEGYRSTHEKLMWVESNVLDMIDVRSSYANIDFAEDRVESRIRYYDSVLDDMGREDYYAKQERFR